MNMKEKSESSSSLGNFSTPPNPRTLLLSFLFNGFITFLFNGFITYSSSQDFEFLGESNFGIQVRQSVLKAVATPDSAVALPLTAENAVLDEIRPYLIADGGNVALHEIDGNVVKLKLQAACGSCPSSVTTMILGIERLLMEKISEVVAVESIPDEETGLELNEENIEKGSLQTLESCRFV
ncbi:unnamed protein product [Fraxinus pennsylvanica]|uniref:NIF system FeS cluster assembly NifU C-terminal domain-containing protein n=1 Tax=Fraxinus pennsylvanica TaxID=56036 RepID=A0AAD1Z7S6_9LAMI|nr:unnamed protein product [Fraxinus pennsylvanica]